MIPPKLAGSECHNVKEYWDTIAISQQHVVEDNMLLRTIWRTIWWEVQSGVEIQSIIRRVNDAIHSIYRTVLSHDKITTFLCCHCIFCHCHCVTVLCCHVLSHDKITTFLCCHCVFCHCVTVSLSHCVTVTVLCCHVLSHDKKLPHFCTTVCHNRSWCSWSWRRDPIHHRSEWRNALDSPYCWLCHMTIWQNLHFLPKTYCNMT